MYSQFFARHYDTLTANVNYPTRARYFSKLIRRHTGKKAKLLLDLACGTGSLSWQFARQGYEVIGVDASPDMLSQAAQKAEVFSGVRPPLFLCQRMEKLDLYGTVDACVCALDSINHLPSPQALSEVFDRVGLFLRPAGVFVFDVNTRYKHERILADNTFVYETDQTICLWRNTYLSKNAVVEVSLDFFTPCGQGLYARTGQRFHQRIFTHRQLRTALSAAGFSLLAVYGEDATRPPKRTDQRLVYLAKKQ